MQHISVLVKEVLQHLRPEPDGTYVDATVGHGGHARELLQTQPDIRRLIGIDQDPDAIKRATEALKPYEHKVTLINDTFARLRDILSEAGIQRISGILFDLGVSTAQLKDPSRGFSIYLEGPLDMRMDTGATLQAKTLIDTLDAEALAGIIYRYGEERWSRRIAARIKSQHAHITTTTALAQIVADAIPAKFHPHKIHPATKTFQALRIAVNSELQAVESGLSAAHDALAPGGRMCVISFHSLEDRIVKTTFKQWATGCICPPELPVCGCGHTPGMKVITRRPVEAGEAERARNPRARSAKLRVAEKR